MKTFLERLGKERLYCDGATGSFLQTRGLTGGELPERWNLTRPDDIIDLARVYFEAGSDIVNTNTFGANHLHYPDPDELRAIIEAGVEHAREGMRRAGRDDGFVALDIGPTGKLLEPMGDLSFEDAYELFSEIVRAGTGADLVLIETMGDTLEAKAAVLAAKENCDLPVCVTTAYGKNGRILTGGSVESIVAMMEGLQVDALGMNCGLDPVQMLPIVKQLVQTASVPVICNPNAGPPKLENGKAVYDLTEDEFAAAMREIASCGVQVIGGCCGTTPEYIRKTVAATKDLPFSVPVRKEKTVISSAVKTIEIGGEPVRIGGQIHPSDEEVRGLLLEEDVESLVDIAYEQEDEGAEILCVNVALPGTDEPALMEETVKGLQAALSLPLLLETSDPETLEKGLRCYNGKALVRFADEKKKPSAAFYAAAAKYGCVVMVPTKEEEAAAKECGILSENILTGDSEETFCFL